MACRHMCPVCGYLRMPEVAHHLPSGGGSDEICSCCGIQFGYREYDTSYRTWRDEWVAGGMRWWSRTPPPEGWDAASQLAALVNGSSSYSVPDLPPDESELLRAAVMAHAPQAVSLLHLASGAITVGQSTELRDAVSEAAVALGGARTDGDQWFALWRLMARLEEDTLVTCE